MTKRDAAREAKQATRDRIVSMRERGQSFTKIAETLNREGVPTMRGGTRWHGGTVRTIVLAESPIEQQRAANRIVDVDGTVEHACGVCGHTDQAANMIYSAHTATHYCAQLDPCRSRRDRARRAAAREAVAA